MRTVGLASQLSDAVAISASPRRYGTRRWFGGQRHDGVASTSSDGGAASPTVIVEVCVPVNPRGSVTESRTTFAPLPSDSTTVTPEAAPNGPVQRYESPGP